MGLLKRLRRFDIKDLSVCKIFAAEDLKSEPIIKAYGFGTRTTWYGRYLGVKILFATKIFSFHDGVLKDPIYGIKYIPMNKLDADSPHKNLYYQQLGNITHFFDSIEIGKKSKISLAKIEVLVSLLSHRC